MTDYRSVDEYISTFPPEIRALLQEMRRTIRQAAPEAQEKISYRMPTFEQNGIVAHFAAFKNHIGFYPAPVGIEAFAEEAKPYLKSKGTLQFPLDKPVPYDLISRIVKFRVDGNLAKASAKTKAKKP